MEVEPSDAVLWMQAGAQECPQLLAAGGWTSIVWPGEGLSSLLGRAGEGFQSGLDLCDTLQEKKGGLVLLSFGRVFLGFCV